MDYNGFRWDHLKKYFSNEKTEFYVHLKKSKRPEDKELLEKYDTMDEQLFEELTMVYLERCKYIHYMAFLQKWTEQHEVETCSKLFDEKKANLLIVLDNLTKAWTHDQ